MVSFKPFRTDAMVGDSVSVDYGPLTIRATIVSDNETSPAEFDCYSESELKAFNRGDWCYVGVMLSIHLDGITLDKCAASLWGIDSHGDSGPYLTEIANDLLVDALVVADNLIATMRNKFAA